MNETEKPVLKLFVVGESSGHHEDWSESGMWCLVFAENEERAKELAGDWPVGTEVALVAIPPTAGVMYWHSPPRIVS